MRRLVWAASARDEFRDIISYIARNNPTAAESVALQIHKTLELLTKIPSGRQGRVQGTYEKTVSGLPYIIAYSIEDALGGEIFVVLRIIHGARNWPDGEWPQ